MLPEKFIRGNLACCSSNTEQMFFGLVQFAYMHIPESIIGKGFHIIKNDPVHHKDRKPGNKLPCNARGIVQSVKNADQYQLINLEAYQPHRQQQVYYRDHSSDHNSSGGNGNSWSSFKHITFSS